MLIDIILFKGSWGESKYEPEEQKLNGGVLVEDKSPPTSSPKKASPDILRSPKARGAPADVVKPEEPVNDVRLKLYCLPVVLM